MKTLVIAATAACALLAVPAMAQAQDANFYGTVGYGVTHIEVEDVDADVGAIEGRAGIQFTPYVAIEGELGIGVSDDSVDAGGIDVTVQMNYQAGGYLRLSWPVSDRIEVFGKVGYLVTEVEASALGYSLTDSDGDLVYGLGAQTFFTDKDGVRLDWTARGEDANTWSIAYVRKF